MKTGHHILAKQLGVSSLFLALAAATMAGCGKKEEIQSYSVAKEKPSEPVMAQQTNVPVNVSPVTWTTPAGWKQVAPTGIRLGELHIAGEGGKQAQVVIFSFPGSTGSDLDNWNRWRREVGLGDGTEKEMTSETVRVGKEEAKLYDISGEANQNIVAALMHDGASWYFKIRGDKEVVAKAKPEFVKFLQSIRFEAGKGESAEVAVSKDADPHAGLGLPSAASLASRGAGKAAAEPAVDNSSPDDPKWNIPASWQARSAPPMVLKSFAVSDDQGGKALVAISKFPGDVGGIFANVNRWRGQLGLPPVTESELPSIVTTVPVAGGNATFVDLVGKDAKTGNPARMVAAAVPNAGFTWFYKLTGDDSVVKKEKEAFTQFVKTVRY